MAKIILKEVATIVSVAVKTYCRIYVLAVIVTVRQSFSTVTNAIVTVNDRWPAVILSAESRFSTLLILLDHIEDY